MLQELPKNKFLEVLIMNLIDAPGSFEIKINYTPQSERPSSIFRTMSDLIDTFHSIDQDLIKSFSVKIEPTFILEEIAVGSIKARIRTILELIDDDALKELDWKKQVGSFLVKGKYLLLDFLKDKKELTGIKEVQELEGRLLEIAKQTNILQLPFYTPVKHEKLLQNLSRLHDATKQLSPDDSAIYISADGEVEVNKNFHISQEAIEEILTRETHYSEAEMVLLVKKPDYLGTSMWDVQYKGRTIPVKISDLAWLQRFQMRGEDLRPGDSLRCDVKIYINYGYDNSIVSEHYIATRVIETIKSNSWNQNTISPWQ